MIRKTLGYVELEWTCPNCGVKNSGLQKICTGCGAPQPDSVQFEQSQTQQFLEDEKKIEAAKAGPDFHCGFCGARNAAGNQVCIQCGADLTGAAKRRAGQIVGAFSEGDVVDIHCPHCNELNPENAAFCSSCGGSLKTPARPPIQPQAVAPKKGKGKYFVLGAIALFILMCIILIIALVSRKDTLTGTVQNIAWARSIVIEQYGPVKRDDWINAIPDGAILGKCEPRFHHTQSEPAPNATEVCGTPYTVDTGTGVGEVVQECEYKVYLEYCEYQVNDWQTYDEVTLEGNDFAPYWPNLQLSTNQREGEQKEKYTVFFVSEQGILEYNPGSESSFRQFPVGSSWLLDTNAFGKVIKAEPAD